MTNIFKILVFVLTLVVLGSCSKEVPLTQSITLEPQEDIFELKNGDANPNDSDEGGHGSGSITDPDDDGDDGLGNGDVITDPDDDDDEIIDNSDDGRLGGGGDSGDNDDSGDDPINKG